MPRYKVTAPGFFNGEYYHPEGKRQVLNTNKPFSKKAMPSWLAEMPKESAGVKAKREAAEKKAAEAAKNKDEQDQEDIDNASFLGDGESRTVETL